MSETVLLVPFELGTLNPSSLGPWALRGGVTWGSQGRSQGQSRLRYDRTSAVLNRTWKGQFSTVFNTVRLKFLMYAI